MTELQKKKYLTAINNCSHYLQVNSTLSELWQVQCHSLCRSEEHSTRLSYIMFCPSSQNKKKKILAQASPELPSAHTHQDWKRSESTMELALIERDKVCCTVIACLSYHKSKGSTEGGEHCQHKAACSAASGCHREHFGTSPTDMSRGGPLQRRQKIFLSSSLLQIPCLSTAGKQLTDLNSVLQSQWFQLH